MIRKKFSTSISYLDFFIFILVFLFLILIHPIYTEELNQSIPSANIEVWLSDNNTVYNQILNSIRTISDKNFIIKYYTEDSRREKFKIEGDTVLYITIGLPATQFVIQNVIDKPILYTMVYAPKIQNLIQENTCGFSVEISLSEYVQIMKEIKPSIQNVYSIYSDPSGKFISAEGDYLDAKYSVIYRRIDASNEIRMSEIFKKLKTADALFLPPDSFFNHDTFISISKFSKENSIILATPFQGFTDEGATFSISPYYSNVGIAIGEKVNAIVNGKNDCRNGSIISPKDYFLYLNKNYSEESNIIIPEKILKRSQTDQLYNSALLLFENDKLKSAEIVVQNILRTDPENKKARNLYEVIRNKNTGEKTDLLLKAAKEQIIKKKYSNAKKIFKEVLNISPNRQEANDGLLELTKIESEEIYNIAERLLKSGNVYGSIRKYLEAIQVWDQNTLAKKRLSELRNKEIVRLPDSLKKAIQFYQQREYELAISEFENIILIDPSNTTANEYLILTKQKKFAIQNMHECKNSKNTNCKLLWK